MGNYDLEKVLPHNHPIILIDDIIDCNLETHTVKTIVRIYEDKMFFDKTINGVPVITGIEFMAQTIGCYSYFRNSQKPPRIGFLLGSRLYETYIDSFENGKEYRVEAKEVFSSEELVSFECLIYNEEEKICAEAVINAYMPANTINLIGMLNV